MPVVSVLWGLGLLTAIATSLLWYGNVSYSLAHNDLEMASINVTVEAGLNRAIDALLDPRPDRRWRTDAATQSFEFNGASIKVSVQDELGKIDLNQAARPPTRMSCTACRNSVAPGTTAIARRSRAMT